LGEEVLAQAMVESNGAMKIVAQTVHDSAKLIVKIWE